MISFITVRYIFSLILLTVLCLTTYLLKGDTSPYPGVLLLMTGIAVSMFVYDYVSRIEPRYMYRSNYSVFADTEYVLVGLFLLEVIIFMLTPIVLSHQNWLFDLPTDPMISFYSLMGGTVYFSFSSLLLLRNKVPRN